MKVTLNLTKAEAAAIMRANLTVGYGVRQSKALESAEAKLHEAVGLQCECDRCLPAAARVRQVGQQQ